MKTAWIRLALWMSVVAGFATGCAGTDAEEFVAVVDEPLAVDLVTWRQFSGPVDKYLEAMDAQTSGCLISLGDAPEGVVVQEQVLTWEPTADDVGMNVIELNYQGDCNGVITEDVLYVDVRPASSDKGTGSPSTLTVHDLEYADAGQDGL